MANDATAFGPTGHVWTTGWCLFVQSVRQPDPLLEWTDDPLTIACSIIALIALCKPIYHVSHALRIFLTDAPGATLHTPNRYPTNLMFLALETASPVVPWVTYYILNSILLTNMSLCVSCIYNNFGQHCLSTQPMSFL